MTAFYTALHAYRTNARAARESTGSDRSRFAARAGVALREMRRVAKVINGGGS